MFFLGDRRFKDSSFISTLGHRFEHDIFLSSSIKILLILLILLTLVNGVWGAVVLKVTPTAASFERNNQNGSYTATVQINADTATQVEALGDIYLEYDLNVFAEVTSADIQDQADGYTTWENKALDTDYSTQGSIRTIRFVKLNTSGANWLMNANTDHPLFTVSLRVRNNAVTGDTVLRLNSILCHVLEGISHTDVLSRVTGATYNITLDQTLPVVTLTPTPGTYTSPQSVLFSTNETGHEAFVLISTNNWLSQVACNDGESFAITGVPGSVATTILDYYGSDLARDKAPNQQAIASHSVYVIDMQAPVLTVTDHTTSRCGIGDIFSITFTANEPLRSYPTVTLGGMPMAGTGSGSGPYTFTRTITGVEAPAGQVVIRGRDEAGPLGNENIDSTVQADLDVGAPSFNIQITPTPAVVNTGTRIDIAISELLLSTPDVTFGPLTALGYGQDLMIPAYQYRVTPSGYGWLMPFGTDREPPYIFATVPTLNQTNVGSQTRIGLGIADMASGVSLNSLCVYVMNIPAVIDGVVQPDFIGTIMADGFGGYMLDLKPKLELPSRHEITVEVYAVDLAPTHNSLTPYNYSFWTMPGGELKVLGKPLAIPTVFDPHQTETEIVYNLSIDSDIELRIYDITGTQIHSESFSAGTPGGTAGLNRVLWAGKIDNNTFVSNGVYMFYVIENSGKGSVKVLGQGKVVVIKD
jgi:hypothetical protein